MGFIVVHGERIIDRDRRGMNFVWAVRPRPIRVDGGTCRSNRNHASSQLQRSHLDLVRLWLYTVTCGNWLEDADDRGVAPPQDLQVGLIPRRVARRRAIRLPCRVGVCARSSGRHRAARGR
jgi:hypothetical protein